MLLCLQVGIRVLGVVENMSGFQQKLGAFTFRQAGADGLQEDVTEKVRELLRSPIRISLSSRRVD
jgi:Mrp family chromosome partitioning ATPase